MVRIGVYYFEPFRIVNSELQPNNSQHISNLLFQKGQDAVFFELPVEAEAISELYETARFFDLILVLGEDSTLRGHARYEKVSFLEHTVLNPINTKYIKQNTKYDPKNNYVCNYVNYHMSLTIPNSLFIHVPSNPKHNLQIAELIEREMIHQSKLLKLLPL